MAPVRGASQERFGVNSMLALRLHLLDESDTIAGLNLFSTKPDASRGGRGPGQDPGHPLRPPGDGHPGPAQGGQPLEALQSNREIGIAVGVLMARHGLTRDQAFDVLRYVSQNSTAISGSGRRGRRDRRRPEHGLDAPHAGAPGSPTAVPGLDSVEPRFNAVASSGPTSWTSPHRSQCCSTHAPSSVSVNAVRDHRCAACWQAPPGAFPPSLGTGVALPRPVPVVVRQELHGVRPHHPAAERAPVKLLSGAGVPPPLTNAGPPAGSVLLLHSAIVPARRGAALGNGDIARQSTPPGKVTGPHPAWQTRPSPCVPRHMHAWAQRPGSSPLRLPGAHQSSLRVLCGPDYAGSRIVGRANPPLVPLHLHDRKDRYRVRSRNRNAPMASGITILTTRQPRLVVARGALPLLAAPRRVLLAGAGGGVLPSAAHAIRLAHSTSSDS